MENYVDRILKSHYLRGTLAASYKIALDFKSFILWKDSPEGGVITHFNGIEKDRDRISYDIGNDNYSLDQVFEYWLKEVKK